LYDDPCRAVKDLDGSSAVALGNHVFIADTGDDGENARILLKILLKIASRSECVFLSTT